MRCANSISLSLAASTSSVKSRGKSFGSCSSASRSARFSANEPMLPYLIASDSTSSVLNAGLISACVSVSDSVPASSTNCTFAAISRSSGPSRVLASCSVLPSSATLITLTPGTKRNSSMLSSLTEGPAFSSLIRSAPTAAQPVASRIKSTRKSLTVRLFFSRGLLMNSPRHKISSRLS
ncbi:MAG: hypothetical protein BWY62_00634 [Firmicutes bacterium ADurb.Bin356]|nr:MAG: hypothetical protein BWY62_00634 [Firmicutes bacterium ADurb.Bin356]